jgi:mRNA interferase RelE/StbE
LRYKVIASKAAEKSLDRLDDRMRRRILHAFSELESNPRAAGVKKLQGEDPQYRIRVGDYRIVYEIYDRELLVLVIRVLHRSIAYRR